MKPDLLTIWICLYHNSHIYVFACVQNLNLQFHKVVSFANFSDIDVFAFSRQRKVNKFLSAVTFVIYSIIISFGTPGNVLETGLNFLLTFLSSGGITVGNVITISVNIYAPNVTVFAKAPLLYLIYPMHYVHLLQWANSFT